MEPVPARPGERPDPGAGHRRQGRDRRRLRGPLLLGHRDLRRAVPRLHRARTRPASCCASAGTRCRPPASGRSSSTRSARCTRGGRSTARRRRRTTPPAPRSTTSTRRSRSPSSATSTPAATSTSSPARAPRSSSRRPGCGRTSASTPSNGEPRVPHPRRHRTRRVHDRRQRQPVHERDGPLQHALRGAGRRPAGASGTTRRYEQPGAPAASCAEDEVERVDRGAPTRCTCPTTRSSGSTPRTTRSSSASRGTSSDTPPENYPLLLHYHPLVIYRHQVLKQADVVLAMVAAQRPVLARAEAPQLRLLRPDHDRRLVAVGVRAGDRGGRRSATTSWRSTTSARRCTSTSPTPTATPATACTSRSAGGVWGTIVFGFAGLFDSGDGAASSRPACPSAWEGVTFRTAAPRLAAAGRARRARAARCTCSSGNPVPIDRAASRASTTRASSTPAPACTSRPSRCSDHRSRTRHPNGQRSCASARSAATAADASISTAPAGTTDAEAYAPGGSAADHGGARPGRARSGHESARIDARRRCEQGERARPWRPAREHEVGPDELRCPQDARSAALAATRGGPATTRYGRRRKRSRARRRARPRRVAGERRRSGEAIGIGRRRRRERRGWSVAVSAPVPAPRSTTTSPGERRHGRRRTVAAHASSVPSAAGRARSGASDRRTGP